MTVAHFQASLLDSAPEAAAELLALTGGERRQLGDGAWVDLLPGWVNRSDELFLRLVDKVAWYAEKRQMYDRVVEVPRLLRWYGEGDELPDPLITRARDALSDYYRVELGEPFRTAGLCYYRNGRDSVAWHGDTIGRSRTQDTMVAIASLGAARKLMLRPRSGGASHGFPLGHGDLIVMGGSCQRTWEHAILKTRRPVGPRISVQFRPRGVR